MAFFKYPSAYGGTYLVQPSVNMYANNNNLSVSFDYYDEDENLWEPFCSATINIEKVPYMYAAIDTNDNGYQLIEFLEKNGFGQHTGLSLHSGYCAYPLFCFNEEKLRECDPKGFEAYAKAHGKGNQSLNSQISSAKKETKTSEVSHATARER